MQDLPAYLIQSRAFGPGKRLRRLTIRDSIASGNFEGAGEMSLVPPPFFSGGGEMGERIRSFDWWNTPLGPIERWPESLKTAVRICIGSRNPIVMWWGRSVLLQFYNDAYISFLGSKKHPAFLGRSGRECWSEIWETIAPMLELVFTTGDATWSEDLLLVLNRNLPREEGYFTFSYSPLWDDAGNIAGIFCACNETTGRVIGDRRLRTLRDLGRTVATAKTPEDACQLTARTLASNVADIPFSLLYLLDDDGQSARRVAMSGFAGESEAAPLRIDSTSTESSAWPIRKVLDGGTAELVTDLEKRFGPLPGGLWPESAETAVVVPIASPGQPNPAGVLVAGLSPRRIIDADYHSFVDLIAGHLSTAIANARAYEQERKRAEALAEIDRAKTVFFSNVSHEFRTPLTLMLGPLEDLLAPSRTDLSAAAKEQLAMVSRNGARLLRLVNTLLDFARIEAGRVQADYEPTKLGAFTAELASAFRSATERAGLQLIVNCPSTETVYVDRDMWEKIVLNLVSNAFKFTFEGAISVTLERVENAVELRVGDTGVGIPAEEMPHLFDRFHRITNTRSRTNEGSGIGLALVQELVKLHGGSVRAESVPGQGSTFIVSVPLGTDHLPERIGATARNVSSTAIGVSPFVEEALRWLPDADKAHNQEPLPSGFELLPSANPSSSPQTGNGRARVLIADDNADMRQYLVRLLQEHYEVRAVVDGQAALQAIREQAPDLVLSDVMMPQLEGFGLVQALRADPALKTIPVILLSARAGEESRLDGLGAGADDYLIKPFSARELLARVHAHVNLSRVRHESEKAIRDSEERFRTFTKATCDVVYRMSPDWKEMRYLDGKEFIADTKDPSRTWLDKYIHPEDQPRVKAAIEQAIQGKTTFELEHRVIRTDGSLGWTFSRAIPILDEHDEIIEWFGAAADITNRKHAEQALRESEDRLRTLAGSLEQHVTERTAELEKAQDELRELSSKLLRTQDEERRRIARDLHDSAGQILAVLGMEHAGLIQRLKHVPADLAAQLQQIQKLTTQVQEEIRTASYLLHPPLLDETGLSSALRWYIEGLTARGGLQIDLHTPDKLDRLSPEAELAVFRVVQESLTNIHRHSGSSKAVIRIGQDASGLWVEIEDYGRGMSAEKLSQVQSQGGGVGIRGMRERIRQLRGHMSIESGSSGTKIRATLPVANFRRFHEDSKTTHVRSAGT
jgi:signal transduction histidine kinase/DNA-binding response OmpR family regulator/GAF domain-containing protein